MSYRATEVVADKTAARARCVRDFDGALHLIWRDPSTTFSRHYRSTDDGRSWGEVAVVSGVGHNFFDPMCDTENRLWLGIQKTNSLDRLQLFGYDPDGPSWSKAAEFITASAASKPRFVIDTSRKPPSTLGLNRIAAFYELNEASQWNVKYADLANPSASGWRLNARAEPQFNPCPAVSPGGNMFCGYLLSTSQIGVAVQRLETTPPTFGPELQFSVSGHVVAEVCDASIIPAFDLPAFLYRRLNGGTNELWLAELSPSLIWVHSQIWDGVNNVEHYASQQRLQYDSRGSVYITTVCDVPGGTPGTGEPYVWEQIRGLGVTSGWNPTRLTGQDSAATVGMDVAVLCDIGQQLNGVRPTQFYQGCACFPWIRPPGSTSSEAHLYWVNLDEWPGDGVYPVILNPVEGEPMYRARRFEVDEWSLPSVALTGTVQSGDTYPVTPNGVLPETTERPIDQMRFVVGYRGTVPRFAQGERVYRVHHDSMTEADKDTLQAFVDQRMEDGKSFTLPISDSETVEVFFVAEEDAEEFVFEAEQLDVGVWRTPSIRVLERTV